MLLGFISLLLTATSSIISNICLPSKFYDSAFTPCDKREVDQERTNNNFKDRKLLMAFIDPHSYRRMLTGLNMNTCPEASQLVCFPSSSKIDMMHAIDSVSSFIVNDESSSLVTSHALFLFLHFTYV